MEPLTLLFVFFVGVFASFIGTNVGSGGLIAIPALIFFGLPPQAAIATNKFGSLGMVTTGFYKFHKAKKIDYRIGIPTAAFALIGAYIGANTLLLFPNELLEKLVGAFILAILVFVLLNRDIGLKKARQTNPLLRYAGYLSFLLIGFWGGFFGGGTATFATYALILLFGQTFLESAGTRKIAALGISIVPIIVFALAGIINWVYGTSLILGMAVGSYFGASYGIKKGDKWVRLLFAIIVVASAVKLLL